MKREGDRERERLREEGEGRRDTDVERAIDGLTNREKERLR